MDDYILEKIKDIDKNLELIKIYLKSKGEASKPFLISKIDKSYTTIDKSLDNIVDFKRGKDEN